MPARKTHEQFLSEIKEIHNDIDIIGEYYNSTTKVKSQCKKCEYIWNAIPKTLLRGCGCPKCGGTLKLTNDEFVNSVHSVLSNIEILDKYINQKAKVKCKCILDGHDWYAYPQNLMRGHGCPKCSAKNTSKRMTYSQFDFITKVFTISPNIQTLSKYDGTSSKLRCKCLICNNEWETMASNLLGGKGCPKCGNVSRAKKLAKSHDKFIFELNKVNNYISVLGNYENSTTKIKCKCLIDGFEWYALPSNLLKGTGCPKCDSSKGELKIENYLNSVGINFIKEYRFSDCKNKRTLPFDFYLPDLNLVIEYDGKQHFSPVNFGGCSDEVAIESFNQTIKNDEIKNQYCNENGIDILRIPYTEEDNINEIIKSKIFS